MKQRFAICLMSALMLSAIGCTDDLGTTGSNPPDEMATVRLSIGLDGMTATRADANGNLKESDYGDGHQPEISDGTRATTLIYAFYKKEKDGRRTQLSIDGKKENETVNEAKQVVRTNVKFPVDDISFELVKGFEYTLAFWAQSGNDDDEDIYKYYDTSDFSTIKVKYADMANNDELRDAFCAKHTINLTRDTEDVNIILKRPFAQINVGMTKTAWEAVEKQHKEIKTSSIKFSGLCDTFDLLEDKVVYDGDHLLVDDIKFTTAPIPSDGNYQYSTSKKLQVDLNRDGKINPYDDEDAEEFIWLSMCYVLVPGYTTSEENGGSTTEYSTLVDLKELNLNYDAYSEEGTGANFEADSFKPGEVPNLPALRNHRTNLILDQWPFVTKVIKVDLCPDYNGDNNYESAGNAETPNDGHQDPSPDATE